MNYAVVNFEARISDVLEAFRDAMEHKELKYGVQLLQSYGFGDEDVTKAIERAIQLCKSRDVDPRRHFRYYYKVDMVNRQVSREWRMSKTGVFLALCNGDPRNPFVSAFQFKLISTLS